MLIAYWFLILFYPLSVQDCLNLCWNIRPASLSCNTGETGPSSEGNNAVDHTLQEGKDGDIYLLCEDSKSAKVWLCRSRSYWVCLHSEDASLSLCLCLCTISGNSRGLCHVISSPQHIVDFLGDLCHSSLVVSQWDCSSHAWWKSCSLRNHGSKVSNMNVT